MDSKQQVKRAKRALENLEKDLERSDDYDYDNDVDIKRVVKRARKGKAIVPGYTRSTQSYSRGLPGEVKYFDTINLNGTVSLTGATNPGFNLVPQGTAKNARIGSRINLTDLHVNVGLSLKNQAASGTGATTRIIIYQDKQANGSAATVQNLLVTSDWRAFRNLDESDRFHVLVDKFITMNLETQTNNAGTISNSVVKHFETFHFSLPHTTITFSGTTGAIGEVRSNNYAMLIIGESVTVDYIIDSRIRFIDL